MAARALQGVRVLDLTRIMAGPFCTMLLGDLGADIIKVELPRRGDDTRSWGPPFVPLTTGSLVTTSTIPTSVPPSERMSTYFMAVNRNKRSIAIDFKSEHGKNVLRDLVKCSDVLVENFIPGKLDELGLGYDQLKVSMKYVVDKIHTPNYISFFLIFRRPAGLSHSLLKSRTSTPNLYIAPFRGLATLGPTKPSLATMSLWRPSEA